MSGQTSKTKPITLRIPLKELAAIDSYAAASGVSRSAAIVHFIRAGIAAESGERPATRSDLVALAAQITRAIEEQPVHVQQAPALEAPEVEKKPWWKRLFE